MSDPAFLFYSNDFLSDVADLTMEERGQYITLLCLQHQKGHLSEKTIRLSLGLNSVSEIEDVIKKFKQDESGNFFNEKLEEVIQARLNFTESRKINGSKGGRPKKSDAAQKTTRFLVGLATQNLPVNVNENENEDINDYSSSKDSIDSSVAEKDKSVSKVQLPSLSE